MRKVNLGFGVSVPTLLLVIATLLLAGCSKPRSTIKPGASEDGVDALFAGREGKTTPASGDEVNTYIAQVRAAIQSHFQNVDTYAGKECSLRIKLAPNGMLIDVKAEGGDPVLCHAAIVAIANASFPKPPSPAVYRVVKNTALEFRPQ